MSAMRGDGSRGHARDVGPLDYLRCIGEVAVRVDERRHQGLVAQLDDLRRVAAGGHHVGLRARGEDSAVGDRDGLHPWIRVVHRQDRSAAEDPLRLVAHVRTVVAALGHRAPTCTKRWLRQPQCGYRGCHDIPGVRERNRRSDQHARHPGSAGAAHRGRRRGRRHPTRVARSGRTPLAVCRDRFICTASRHGVPPTRSAAVDLVRLCASRLRFCRPSWSQTGDPAAGSRELPKRAESS